MFSTLRMVLVSWLALNMLILSGCQKSQKSEEAQESQEAQKDENKMNIEKTVFGKMTDDREVDLYTCTNASGSVVKLSRCRAACGYLPT